MSCSLQKSKCIGADLRLSALEARIREYARLRASSATIGRTGIFEPRVIAEDLALIDKKLVTALAAAAELKQCLGR